MNLYEKIVKKEEKISLEELKNLIDEVEKAYK